MSETPYRDRREVPRYSFIASAEEVDIVSNTRLTSRVSEISVKGCYLDTLNPFPEGTEIRLGIDHAGETFSTLGKVIYVLPNMGMGVAFTGLEEPQKQLLLKWIGGAGGTAALLA